MYLPNRNSNFNSPYNPDGSPKFGTIPYYYMEDALKNAYEKGAKDIIEMIKPALHRLVFWREEYYESGKYEKFIPERLEELEKYIHAIWVMSEALSRQINNYNVNGDDGNYREGTRKIIMRIERIFGINRGFWYNKLSKHRWVQVNSHSVGMTKHLEITGIINQYSDETAEEATNQLYNPPKADPQLYLDVF